MRLGRAIDQAVHAAPRVDPVARKPREIAAYLWCPNCASELDDQDQRGKELRCANCGLSLPAVLQLELLEFKQLHLERTELWES